MKNSSLSLIAALYNSAGATDLYKEIYYPIIRYSVTEMYRRDEVDSEHYYALTELNQLIKELFDIDIPTLVLGRAVQLMGREYGVKFTYYTDTTSFRILEIVDDRSNADVDTKAEEINQQLNGLEKKFRSFLKTADLDCEKSFFDFFADSEKAIECYLNQEEGLPIVNEEYVNLARFIQWTIDHDNESYVLVKRTLWSSIIAGFLQRKNEALGIKSISTVAYYIDTSLIFALLGYDTIDNVNYARELVKEIVESGATPVVHPLTREEIKLILESIERQGAPDPVTAIGEAYYREKKHLSDLLRLKNKLYETLTQTYKISCPIEGPEVIEEYRRKYRDHADVQMLKEKWKEKEKEDFREIHDVVLCSTVNKANKYKQEIEKYTSFFVTRNSDLINILGKRLSPAAVIHPANVIMNLWIHSAQSRNFKQAMLTEIITRCLALNQTDAHRRLRVFAKYAKQAGLSLDEFQGMYSELIRRAAKTIKSSDIVIENESKESVKQEDQIVLIKAIASEADKSESRRQQKQYDQREKIDTLSAHKKRLEKEGKTKDKKIANLQATIQEQESAYSSEKEMHDQDNQRHKKLGSLYVRFGKASEEKTQISKDRDSYVTDSRFWFAYISQWLMFITILGAVGYLCWQYLHTRNVPVGITWALIVPGVMLVMNFSLNHWNFPIFNGIDVGIARNRDRQIQNWNLVHRERIEKNESELAELIEQITTLDGDLSKLE